MTDRIRIACEPASSGWTCRVTVTGHWTSTTHEVVVLPADLARLDPGAESPDGLVRRSFEFLLAREPKESILRRFDITVIGRYFPEWEREVARG
jgi:hypothetical protein